MKIQLVGITILYKRRVSSIPLRLAPRYSELVVESQLFQQKFPVYRTLQIVVDETRARESRVMIEIRVIFAKTRCASQKFSTVHHVAFAGISVTIIIIFIGKILCMCGRNPRFFRTFLFACDAAQSRASKEKGNE